MRSAAVTVLAAISCAGPAPHKPVARNAPAATMPTPLERAEELERGDGVARDYQAAAAIYRDSCAEGSGDLTACRRLMRAELDGRGADVDRRHAATLATVLCARDDLTGCFLAAMASDQPAPSLIEKYQRLLAEPCDAHHLARCEVPLNPFSYLSQSSSVEDASHRFAAQGCALGVIEACIDLRYAEGEEHDAAVVVLTNVCRRGDAAACDAIDKPLDAAPLCKAHDYHACIALGCAGDAAAAEIARAHGVELDCDRRFPYAIAPVTTGAVAKMQQPFDSLEFKRIGATQPGPLWFEVYNVGTHVLDIAIGEVYAYDESGRQIGRHHWELRQVGLEPGHGRLLSVGAVAGASFDPCVDVITFFEDHGRAHVARCPDQKPRGTRWGNGGDNVQLRVSAPEIPFADDWTQTFARHFSEPFERTHPGIVVEPGFGGGTVALASPATDIALLTKDLGGSVVELPVALSPVAIAYHVPGVDDLRLSATTLARILGREITRWDDPAIARDNRGRTLPSLPIVVIQEVSRSDELVVTTYLARSAGKAWKLGATQDKPLFADVTFERSYEIGQKLADTAGAIAYVGPGVAAAAGLSVAQLQNARGAFVAPTPATIASGAYPLVASRSAYVATKQPDAATADAVRAYAAWLLGDGQAVLESLGLVRQPLAVTKKALERLRDVGENNQAP